MVFTKICGITRLEDAEAAIEAGADALGFVLWPGSPRAIPADRARDLIARLPVRIMKVGVFVNQGVEQVNAIAQDIGLTAVQLHGDEDPSFARRIAQPVIKAVTSGGASHAAEWPSEVTLLIDAHDPVRRGGTGRSADWTVAAAVASARRVILAGGLTPANVRQAIETVRPYGIDVSSGVEQAPGIKDRERLRALFEAMRAAVTPGAEK
jgi:phosphoribosylanthranilate isomerase